MKRLLPLLLIGFLFTMTASAQETPDPNAAQIAAAEVAGNAWLKLLDADDYKGSYAVASSMIKGQLDEARFVELFGKTMADANIAPAKPLVSRQKLVGKYAMNPPNAPAGEYVNFQYRTQKGDVTFIETLGLINDGGEWKMVGYFIQPAE